MKCSFGHEGSSPSYATTNVKSGIHIRYAGSTPASSTINISFVNSILTANNMVCEDRVIHFKKYLHCVNQCQLCGAYI